MRVAVYALLHDQDLATPMKVFATDEAGNTASADIDSRVFPKVFRRSRIEVPDTFLQRVVPAILENTPDFAREVADPNDLVAAFLKINGELRRKNAETIAALAQDRRHGCSGRASFQQLGNSQVEAAFADHRTYFHDGKEIDQQVHLGFDLAVTAAVPIVAAGRGKVVFADYLGIYGNCVIIDHGLGVQSLYAHLSSIDVKPGDDVRQGTAARPERHDRAGRRRPPALHDAGRRLPGEPGGLVVHAVDGGPGAAKDPRSRGDESVAEAA